MPLADLHAGPLRAFVQPIIGYARGVNGGNGPADQTGIDLLQGFADLNLSLGEGTKLTLRGGRELVALGSERLIGTRYGPNIPQPFDGVRATSDLGRLRLDLMDLRAVEIKPGDFDDHASDRRRLRAKLFGGACMSRNLADIGGLNARFAQSFLSTEDIPCDAHSNPLLTRQSISTGSDTATRPPVTAP